jgi:transcription elongation factor GreA-like protein
MNEIEREDMIKSVSGTVEKNFCAIKREDLYKKYKNTDPETLKSVIEAMKNRGLLKYDQKNDKYRLVL